MTESPLFQEPAQPFSTGVTTGFLGATRELISQTANVNPVENYEETDEKAYPQTDGERLDALADNIAALNERVDSLTGAVNQFGEMLQYIVNTVAQAGQAIAKGGIGGLMGLMGGGKNE